MEVINNLKIGFIAIFVTRTQSLTRNTAGILVLNRDTDSHFVLAVLSKHKIDFEIISNQISPASKPGKNYSVLHLVS